MSWTHLQDVRPRASKKHTCYICGWPIPVGEIHIKRSGISDGEPSAVRMHVACEKLTHYWSDGEWTHHDPAEFRDDYKESLEKSLQCPN